MLLKGTEYKDAEGDVRVPGLEREAHERDRSGTSRQEEQMLGRVVLVEGVGAVEEALDGDAVADAEATEARGEGPRETTQ